jgi:hypothetical protein
MSKTTLRKRISLVAVTALTAGVLSVVATPAANANIAAGTPTQAVATEDKLNVAVIASTTGVAVTPAPQLNAATNKSLGLIYKDASSTTAQSATMLGTGALSLYTKAATIISLVATGGSFSGAVDALTAQTNAPQVSSNLRGILTNGTATDVGVTWTPGAVGTYTISAYKGDGAGTVPSATLGLSRGTLFAQITVTAVAAGNAGTYSPTYTLCNVGATATTATGVDASGASAKNNGATAFINFALADAYGTQLATGLPLVASLTGSAVLDIASTASSAISTSDVDATVTAGTVSVKQAVANAPATATVTLSYNGTTVCTKTVTFAGEVASLKAVAVRAQTTATTNIIQEPLNALGGGTIRVEAFDASGTKVNPLTAGGGAAAHTQFGVVAASLNSIVTGVTFYSGAVATGTASTDASGLWPLAFTQASHACATQGSNAGLQVTFQNPSGTIITSPAFSARCASAATSYTASWDKASYIQGDIAKLTVQFKDVKGNNAPSTGANGGAAAGTITGTTATITAPMMTLVGTLTNNTAVDGNGAIVYTYTVGTTGTFTDGSYNSIVDFPALSETTGSVQTATYKVASSATPGVSNADVLKSIVALIASINKQIQALQKLILKR